MYGNGDVIADAYRDAADETQHFYLVETEMDAPDEFQEKWVTVEELLKEFPWLKAYEKALRSGMFRMELIVDLTRIVIWHESD